MAGLLAAEDAALAPESLEHVAVADVGRHDADPALGHQPVEAEVRHRRHRDEVDAEVRARGRHDLVAVDLSPVARRRRASGRRRRRTRRRGRSRPRGRSRCRSARSVAPQPALMFVPSGSSPIAATSAPSCSNACGAMPLSRRRSRSRRRSAGRRGRSRSARARARGSCRSRSSTRSTAPGRPRPAARRAAPRSPPRSRR